MKIDANNGRIFSNIVAEYNVEFDEEHPVKIVGGQHRIKAIQEALKNDVEEYHGIKVYFDLNMEQRLDVQLISNTNIAVSADLLDRMMETVKGPELRNWCHEVGLLDDNSDFADKKQRGNCITVREARTFIINYFLVAIKNINILGAIFASFFAFLVPVIINHKRLKRIFKMKIPIIKLAIMPTISSAVMALSIFICRIPIDRIMNIIGRGRIITCFVILILVLVGGLIYLFTLILLGGINKKDLDMISPRLFTLLPRFLRKNM